MSNLSKMVVVVLIATAGVVNAQDVNTAQMDNKEVKATVVSQVNAEASLIQSNLAIYFLSDVITVSYINRDMETAVFTIADKSGKDLYRKTTRNNPLVHHRLATNNLPEGKYIAKLKVGKESYSKEIQVVR